LKKRIIVGVSGASGAILAVRLVEIFRQVEVESHLILSEWGEKNTRIETDFEPGYIKGLAAKCYDNSDLSAPLSSGSFKTDGMIIIPCSMKTLAAISCGYSDCLITRAADVTLKERRRLVLVPRETPLNSIHLQNMLSVSQVGAIVMPFMPSFYNRPATLSDAIDQFVYRVVALFDIRDERLVEWNDKDKRKPLML
jgi:polyprenyl P-hydroxybenzoate/phenylacrylic acid decarboxylase-like protein